MKLLKEVTVMNFSSNRRWWALAALTLALLAVGLDVTVLSVALPTLASSLHASEAELQWFVASYSLALVAMLLPGGLFGDRFGRKKMLLGALAVFGMGSVAAAFSSTSAEFIASRAVLGLAAAFLIPLSMSVLRVLFSDEERPRAVGVWAGANFLALPIGPILGGWMLTQFWWGSVFLINVPVAVLGFVAVAFLVPESRSAERTGLDPIGVLSSSLGLAVLVYGLIQAGENGWGDPGAVASLVIGAVVLVGFVFWERRLSRQPDGQPLVDLALFSSPTFTWGTILVALGGFALFGILFAAPQYFQAILGADAQGSGLRLLPVIGGFVVGAALAARLGSWVGPKLTAALGFVIMSCGLALGATTSLGSGDGFLILWTALAGAGMSLALVTAANGALGALSEENSGVGSGLMQAVNKIGGPFGAAILGSVINSVYREHLTLAALPAQAVGAVQQSVFGGLAVAQRIGSTQLAGSVRLAFVDAMDAALWVSAGVAVVGVVLALAFLPGRARAVGEIRTTGPEGLELGHEH
jgi:EmrB/QacA subfamily drug resistance transporter